ncbi:hypothetical protein ES705_50369 [subsurface metagenome]
MLDLTKERIIRNIKELSRIESLVDNLGELIRLESPEMRISTVKIDTGSFFNELRTGLLSYLKKDTFLCAGKEELSHLPAMKTFC